MVHGSPASEAKQTLTLELPALALASDCSADVFGDFGGQVGGNREDIWLWVKTNGIPVWGRCTTHFSLF